MEERSRGTHFPDLPQPPNIAAALERIAKSIDSAQQQATATMQALDGLQKTIESGKQVLNELLKRRVQA